LRYQPIVELATARLVGVEALVRWHHPTRGLLEPDQFLPAAEASGLIVPIGHEVLDLAAGVLATVPATDLPGIAINLSPQELAQPDLITRLVDTIAARAIDVDRLSVEITEHAVLDDLDLAVRTLQEIRNLGIRLAIDDFGTGYSSLSYLRRLPVDSVKIDRSFITELGNPDADATIVAGIIGLARGLGLGVVAEGVERPEQAQALQELGCTLAQGYLFSPPVALDELLGRDLRAGSLRHDARH
jgi:EAL domain-containing protein (putative c-di-GMP-specific phosphodiesterase class I)